MNVCSFSSFLTSQLFHRGTGGGIHNVWKTQTPCQIRSQAWHLHPTPRRLGCRNSWTLCQSFNISRFSRCLLCPCASTACFQDPYLWGLANTKYSTAKCSYMFPPMTACQSTLNAPKGVQPILVWCSRWVFFATTSWERSQSCASWNAAMFESRRFAAAKWWVKFWKGHSWAQLARFTRPK